MADKPIIFSAPMVRALLDGRKFQTRRVLKPPYGTLEYLRGGTWRPICTKFFPGDRLWVREGLDLWPGAADYRADGRSVMIPSETHRRWVEDFPRSSASPIHMPRWASRLTLVVTDVRVQRLQEISEDDAEAEGIQRLRSGRGFYDPTAPKAMVRFGEWTSTARQGFQRLWNSLHGPEAWDANPWVAAISFTTHHTNIDSMEKPDG